MLRKNFSGSGGGGGGVGLNNHSLSCGAFGEAGTTQPHKMK